MTSDELEARLRERGVAVTLSGTVRERDAAAALGVTPRTLREWRARGKPPRFCRLNGSVRYAVADLATFMKPEE